MKISFLSLLFIPVFSFAQLTKNEKVEVENYAIDLCNCINDLMAELHPKTGEIVLLFAEVGEAAALKEIDKMKLEMSSREVNELLASFVILESPDFLNALELCDKSELLNADLRTQINNAKGPAHDYLEYILSGDKQCKIANALYGIGGEE